MEARSTEQTQLLQDSQFRMTMALQELQELRKLEVQRAQEFEERDQRILELEMMNADKEQ